MKISGAIVGGALMSMGASKSKCKDADSRKECTTLASDPNRSARLTPLS